MEINVRNANEMFQEMFWKFKTSGVKTESRNGPVVRIPEPVLTRVRKPAERVLFHKSRNANHIFHLMESIWILAGRNDVSFLQHFNSKIGQYSDDGEVFNAAYGHRLRSHFGRDQLVDVILSLRNDAKTRQAVLQLWDPADLIKATKDKACNTQLIFEIVNNKLNMCVINRSNDAWYGYSGANIVHFTILQEFVACSVGVELGEYRTFSTNLHLYTELYDALEYIECPPDSDEYDLYSSQFVKPLPLMMNDDYKTFLKDCEMFCDDPFNLNIQYNNYFFEYVLKPMAQVVRVRKAKENNGVEWAASIIASDWKAGVFNWIEHLERARAAKNKLPEDENSGYNSQHN